MSTESSTAGDPQSDSIKIDVVRGIWHKCFTAESPSDLKSWIVIISFYTAECKKAISCSRGEYTTVRARQDVIGIAEMLEQGCTRQTIAHSLLALDT